MILTTGYPSSRNITNIKTLYTFIDGQKKYFCKDNLKFDNYAVDKIKSSIIYAGEFNFEGSKVLKVVYIENNIIKTKLFDILPETYTKKGSLAKICGNKLAVLYQNYDTKKQHLYFINNILTDTGMVEINLDNIPAHNLVGTSSFNVNISNDGIYLEESAPQSIKSTGIITTYNYKTFIIFVPFDNLNNFITIDELSNFDSTYQVITSIPDGMLFFDYKINRKIYLTHKGKVNYITDDIYSNTNNEPIPYLALQGNYLYGGSSAAVEVYAKNLITNEITISSREVFGGTPSFFTYLLKNELWKYKGSPNDYYIKLNKSGNVSQIQKYYDNYPGKFFHNNYNARVWYKVNNNYTVTFISPNLEDISYSVSNLPADISITGYSDSDAPGVVLTTTDAWYASLDMVNFTQI